MNAASQGLVETDRLRTLTTSECGLELLRSLVKDDSVNPFEVLSRAKQTYHDNGEPDIEDLANRLSDAWAWLESHGFLGPDPVDGNGRQRVTKRGGQVAASPNALAEIIAEDRLAMSLHELLEAKVRPIFSLGNYETAAFAALKEVEVRVRDIAGANNSLLGVKLMHSAFTPNGGTLVDPGADPGEQVATMELFAGAIGTFKNPASHRTVDYHDPTEAAEVILLADLLMRLLDRVERRRADETLSG